MDIVTGRDVFECSFEQYIRGRIWTELARRRKVDTPNIKDISDSYPARAFISHGRLVASCPNCSSAEYVWPDSLLMACPNCGNADIKGKIRRVAMPPDYEQAKELLLQRPNPETQNYLPGDTIESLQEENELQGDIQYVQDSIQ